MIPHLRIGVRTIVGSVTQRRAEDQRPRHRHSSPTLPTLPTSKRQKCTYSRSTNVYRSDTHECRQEALPLVREDFARGTLRPRRWGRSRTQWNTHHLG